MTDVFAGFSGNVFGNVKSKYVCSIHGDQGSICGVSVELHDQGGELPEALTPYIGRRNYCWCCWVDWMDRNMQQLEEVEVK